MEIEPKKNFVTSLMAATNLHTPPFKEDTYFISDLKPSEKKALQDLKHKLITDLSPYNPNPIIWGIPHFPAKNSTAGDELRSDVILLKFLCARDFKVQDSLDMLLKSLSWRKDFQTDAVLDEDLGLKELEGVVASYMHGHDRAGHPVCYNAYGILKDKVFVRVSVVSMVENLKRN
ncbi:hypothetical protein CASFOL_027298 [Castilleja foliolosa]|uniref:CRAL/TRIO N-terminal domain-containing protein n=1 Tax=Castilleja foliolosa TaxID=1961234 RepID=A0ABD3CFG9_9LAMI